MKILKGLLVSLFGAFVLFCMCFAIYQAFTDPAKERERTLLYWLGGIVVVPWSLIGLGKLFGMLPEKIKTGIGVAIAGSLLITIACAIIFGITAGIRAMETAPAWVFPMFLLYLYSKDRR